MDSNCYGCAKNLQNFFSTASFLTANRPAGMPQMPTTSTQLPMQAPQAAPQYASGIQLPNLQNYAPQMHFANQFQTARNFPF